MDCLTCQSNSGERRISPGPTIYESRYWYVEHAYPCGMKGWLVLVLKRHLEAMHDLEEPEFLDMAVVLRQTTRVLKSVLGCRKEYVMFYAEAPGFQHVHIHVVARADDLPDDLVGPRIFAMLKVGEQGAVPPDEIKSFCEHLREEFRSN